MNFMFPYILGIVTPTDELIFFRGVGQPAISFFDDLVRIFDDFLRPLG